MIKKIFCSVVLLTTLLFLNVSCEKYLDVNKNEDAPDYVDGYLYLAGIIQSYQGMYYDIRATAPLTQMMGTTSYTTFAQNYYAASNDAAGEMWRMSYWLQGMNLENMINQSIAAENWTLAGIGYAIKANSWDQLTKYHCDLPMVDAYVPGLLSHDYDYQEDIYPQIRQWARTAIKYLEMEDNTVYGNTISDNDFIYYGDKDKWIRFAYGVIVRNLASLSNKSDFATTYAPELIDCAAKSFQSVDDDATVKVGGGGDAAPEDAYNNCWGTLRGFLSYAYFQHEYAVQVFTGTVPVYDETTGFKLASDLTDTYYPYELSATQIICDTVRSVAGHYDPRVIAKLGTRYDPTYDYTDNIDTIKEYRFYGSSFTSASGPIGTAPSFYGRNASVLYEGAVHDGSGRWIYRDDAPYILMTYAELKFCLAEAYWKLGQKPNALAAFKDGVKADLEFTQKYIKAPTKGSATGGDKITSSVFAAAAAEYAAGPFVDGLAEADFTLSHIMMQKWVALYPWGACEAWVDMRKYMYDIEYTGDYPYFNNGWDLSKLNQKWDTDATKVYKGFYLTPANVTSRTSAFNTLNSGSPCFRIRPRYNSEYMWNLPSLKTLIPIAGTADNYQCSIPWFAYPGDLPTTVPTSAK